MKFLKFLIIQIANKYGSFIWFGSHLSMTQTNWHWLLECSMIVFVNIFLIFALYLEYNENIQKTTITQ